MLSRVYSAGLSGIDGFEVTVECSGWDRIPAFELVGLPDAAVKEAKDRVRGACENSGLLFPSMELTVNLAPANLKKEGSGFDLAILCSILQCDGRIPHGLSLEGKCFVGELSLSGEVRPVEGVLCLCLAARAAGRTEIFVPAANAAEAAVVDGMTVYGVPHFKDLLAHLLGQCRLTPTTYDKQTFGYRPDEHQVDFADVRGQQQAKRALEIAAAGGHNVLLIGPPGAGKSMLAKRLPTILPDLTFEEALETSRIHSVMGLLGGSLVSTRPFRAPHHTVSAVGMVGGGASPHPGEISLSHNGVLFLDELPEFTKQLTETLRQPIEDGVVTVTRAAARRTYPSSFMLVCAMNPCRCGFFGDPGHTCSCTPKDIRRYLDRISGPLLDRIDIQVELPPVTYSEIAGKTEPGEPSAAIRERVNRGRAYAAQRFAAAGDRAVTNATMTPAELRRHCRLDEDAHWLLQNAFERMGLSARGHDKILRVARTIADLAGAPSLTFDHIAEAIQYRSLDRKYWNR
ncbi:MAG: YifB family Mg chelatase-like AAA ATPase [Eubacteriales bacterium]